MSPADGIGFWLVIKRRFRSELVGPFFYDRVNAEYLRQAVINGTVKGWAKVPEDRVRIESGTRMQWQKGTYG